MKPGAHTDERGNTRPSRAIAAGVRRSVKNLAERLDISRQAIRASEDLLRELTVEQVTYMGIGSPTPEPPDGEPPAEGSPSTSA